MKVKLTSKEMILAANAGVLCQVENLKKQRVPAHGAGEKNDWQLHIEGCLGEWAVAKGLGRYPSGLFRFRESDLGDRIEVRTRPETWHDLLLHKEDDDKSRFVLAIGFNGEYDISGWVLGLEGKLDEYWKDPAGGRPAYFVPSKELHPFSELIELL